MRKVAGTFERDQTNCSSLSEDIAQSDCTNYLNYSSCCQAAIVSFKGRQDENEREIYISKVM